MNSIDGDSEAPINQQVIADGLGISRTTVSRCFTNHPGISPVTRARVFNFASKLGYQHMEMRASKKGKPTTTKRMGVLICTEIEEFNRPDYESPGVELYAGVSEFAQVNNIKLNLHYLDPKEKTIDGPSYRKLTALQGREWDGVLLIYPFPRDVVDSIHLNFPMVSLVEQYGTAAVNCVDVDHYKGIATMINRLVALGHEQIGFFTRQYPVEAQWSLRRFSAYVEKMIRRGCSIRDENIVNVIPKRFVSNEDNVREYEASMKFVRERVKKGVTAWVCAADHQAYDLIASLQRSGLRVPEDVSITGFDGIQKPDWAPSLTTAIIPYREIGYTAGQRLLDIMRKRFGSSQHILVSSRLREGDTSGRVPTKKRL